MLQGQEGEHRASTGSERASCRVRADVEEGRAHSEGESHVHRLSEGGRGGCEEGEEHCHEHTEHEEGEHEHEPTRHRHRPLFTRRGGGGREGRHRPTLPTIRQLV